MRVGSPRQGARRAILGRDGKNVAAGDDHGALTVRRQIDRLGMFRCIDKVGAAGGEVLLNLNWNRSRLSTRQVVTPDVARLFEDDRVFPNRRELDIKILEARQLL